MFVKGSRVTWVTASGVHGSGVVISEEFYIKKTSDIKDPGFAPRVLVAVDAPSGEEHRVICCAATWLLEE